MNRTIKFRAWVFPLYPEADVTEVPHMIKVKSMVIYGEGNVDYVNSNTRKYKDDMFGFNIMQYTGLKDKNGIEIYEKDILTKRTRTGFEPPLGCVEFNNGGFVMRWRGGKSLERIYQRLMRHFQIIGNSYENPELLED